MSEFSLPRLLESLSRLLENVQSRRLCVSLSGGLDSVTLLHALAQLLPSNDAWQLRAIHVDHQLQKDSNKWAQQCADLCNQLRVPCKVLTVEVLNVKAHGVEAAARMARYAALAQELEAEEILLTAHHADDQLETMLIALMRGAGLNGLASMPAVERFEQAWHVRPLLEFTRTQLQSWATQQALNVINDPSNEQTRFDRNFLRAEIIPTLKRRWPSAAITASRSTAHLSEALLLLEQYVVKDLANALTGAALNTVVLQSWAPPRRRAVIRQWLQHNEVLLPATRIMRALEHDMFKAAGDRVPCVRWGEYSVHRYRDHLHLEKETRPEHIADSIEWHWREPLPLPYELGWLRIASQQSDEPAPNALALAAAKLPATLKVGFRQGGEHLQLPGEPFHRELKKKLQEAAVLPWWRGRIPLVYVGQKLVAVAGLWADAEFTAAGEEAVMQLSWQPPAALIFAD